MKLYTYWRSQASFRVRIALRLKGLAADISLDLLKGEQFDASYRALNPEMVVPTFLDGDGPPLVQSLAILDKGASIGKPDKLLSVVSSDCP